MGDRLSLGGWRHLTARFLESVAARSPGPREQSEAAALLREGEEPLFWGQPGPDQRHGLEAARAVLRRAPGRRDLARAALLHDVGKQAARLGIPGRVLASALGQIGIRPPGRMGVYLRHGEEGARMLERAGAEDPVVGFARHHHGRRPPEWDPRDWELLQWADRLGERGKPPGRDARSIP